MLYRLTGGNHVLDGRTYKEGDTIKTNLELDKIFSRTGKFQRIHSPDVAGAKSAPPQSIDMTQLVDDSLKYNLAEKGLQVTQNGSWYNVVDMISGKKLNEKSLRYNELENFIRQYLDSDAVATGQDLA